jgi:hypothetical protein
MKKQEAAFSNGIEAASFFIPNQNPDLPSTPNSKL